MPVKPANILHINWLFISLIIFIGGCSKFSGEETVDKNYLNSTSFRHFEKQYTQEQDVYRKSKEAIEIAAVQVANTLHGKELKFPVTIDGTDVQALRGVAAKNESYKDNLPNIKDSFYMMGRIKSGEKILVLFLACKATAYTNCTVWAAVVHKQGVMDLKPLAVFIKNISVQTKNTIRIFSFSDIRVETKRLVFYPIKQQNVLKYGYRISEDGLILREG